MKTFRGNPRLEYELAIRQNDVKRLRTLKQLGVPPCEGAILYALKLKNLDLVPILMAAGADPNYVNPYGLTALGYATQYCDAPAVRELLKGNTDVELESFQIKPLVNAATWGKTESVHLLLEHGADPNGKNPTGLTALLQATEYGYTEIVEMLVGAGADPKYRGPTGQSAIAIAKKSGRKDLLEILGSSSRCKNPTSRNKTKRSSRRSPSKRLC